MYGLTDALSLIIQTLGSLYLLIVLLRFILQLVRADFYNPLSQFTVKATQPLLKPLRRFIPSIAGLDTAYDAGQFLRRLDLLAIDAGDHVARLYAGSLGGAIGLRI